MNEELLEIEEITKEAVVADVNENLERAKAIVTIIVVAAINIANVGGYAMDADPIVNAITSVFAAISILYAWWKNQNITIPAMKGQKLIDVLKSKDAKDAKHAA